MECLDEISNEISDHISRSPNFSKEEIIELVNLVEKYKHVILNKSVTNTAKHAKEITWMKISKEYNKLNFKHHRNPEALRMKWSNLKKQCIKLGKNLDDDKIIEDVPSRVIALSYEADNINEFDVPIHSEEELQVSEDDSDKTKAQRAINFSPLECKLLLDLVKEEKRTLFLKGNTGKITRAKNNAWERIAERFNKHNDQKRTSKALMTKFRNMKTMARRIKDKDYIKDACKSKHVRLKEDVIVKEENLHEDKSDEDSMNNDVVTSGYQESPSCVPDPLFSVLHSDVANGFSSSSKDDDHIRLTLNSDSEVKEKMLQLINYQMETAKLERQKLIDKIESRSIEQSLRLRAARLEALAAESRFPPAHPALQYTPDEALAKSYLKTAQKIAK